jgi:hypothetical protein
MHFLDHFVTAEALTPQSGRRRKSYHVFLDLLAAHKEQLTTAAYMDLYYFHTLCEKCLAFARRRELHSTDIILTQLRAVDRLSSPDNVRHAVEANYLACTSYIEYVQGNYEEARQRMTSAIHHTREQGIHSRSFLSSLYELNMNLIRIAFKTRDRQTIISCMANLLRALFYDEVDTSNPLLDPGVSDLNEEERINWLHYLTDNLTYGLLTSLRADRREADAYWLEILSLAFPDERPASWMSEQQKAMMILQLHAAGDVFEADQRRREQFELIRESGYHIKRTIMEQYIEHARQQNIALEAHPNFDHFKTALAKYELKPFENPEPVLA